MANDWSKYELLSEDDPTCVTWASNGLDGSGKSYFGCTAPSSELNGREGIFVCGFDPHGMSRVDKSIRAGKVIKIGRYGFNHLKQEDDRQKVRKDANDIWKKFVEEYTEALKHVRSILWDREDLAWELRRYAAFGGEKNEGSKTGALDYGDLNSEYAGLIQMAHDANVNLGLLRGYTEKWVAKFDPQSGKMRNYNTGDLVPDGFKKVADHVDIVLNHRWDDKQKAYVTKIGKFPNKEFRDKEEANLDFGTMALNAFPDSDVSNWM